MKKRIGLVGVGVMGRKMLDSFLSAGYSVFVYDKSDKARSQLSGLKVNLADELSQVSQNTDIIFLSLPGPAQVEEVMTGKGGLLENPPVSGIVIDTTTSTPETSEKMFGMAKEKGFDFVDAPILGRPSGLGNWLFPVGGEDDVIDKVEEHLLIPGKKVVRIPGGVGSGHKLKLLNQLLFTVTNAITCEMMAIVEKTGLRSADVYEAIRDSGAATVSGLFIESAGKIVAEDFDPLFPVDMLRKDARLGIEMAKHYGASPLLAELSQTMNNIASNQGYGKEDSSALFKTFQSLYQEKTEL